MLTAIIFLLVITIYILIACIAFGILEAYELAPYNDRPVVAAFWFLIPISYLTMKITDAAAIPIGWLANRSFELVRAYRLRANG